MLNVGGCFSVLVVSNMLLTKHVDGELGRLQPDFNHLRIKHRKNTLTPLLKTVIITKKLNTKKISKS